MIDMYHNTKNFLLRWVRIAFYQTGLKPCDPADLCLLNSQNYKCEPPTPEKGDRALNKGAEEAKKKKKKNREHIMVDNFYNNLCWKQNY
jgi:hypothetical protein